MTWALSAARPVRDYLNALQRKRVEMNHEPQLADAAVVALSLLPRRRKRRADELVDVDEGQVEMKVRRKRKRKKGRAGE